jgi:hypothetical protein
MYEKIRQNRRNLSSFVSFASLSSSDLNLLRNLKSHKKYSDYEKLYSYEIPVCIFRGEQSILESLVIYLKDNLGFSLKKIAEVLDRKYTTIHTTYKNGISRCSSLKTDDSIKIPLHIFSSRDISPFEGIVLYLKHYNGLSNHRIAQILEKDNRVIWTINNRGEKKVNLHNFIITCEQLGVEDELFKIIKKNIRLKYSLTSLEFDYLFSHVRLDDYYIPVSLFRNDISPLKALVVYLRDGLGLANKDVSQKLSRSPSLISVIGYNKLIISDVSYGIPLKTFSDRNFSIMEHVVRYLMNEEDLTLTQTARILGRDPSIIWKINHRYEVKNG